MIGCNQIVSKDIIYVEFGAYPIETIFKLVSFLHKDTIFKWLNLGESGNVTP